MQSNLLRVISIILVLAASVCAHAADVVVITDKYYPIYHIPEHARVIRLDTPEAILHEVSAGLPADHEQASLIAKERLDNSVHRQLRGAFQDIADAWALGVQKIPAVVVDRKYVVYGEADVVKALEAIRQYREQEQKQEMLQ